MEHGLNTATIAVISACVVLWVVVSARLGRLNISAPMAFVVMGLVLTHRPLSLVHLNLHSSAVRSLAELTLALVLFADASRVNIMNFGRTLASRSDYSQSDYH